MDIDLELIKGGQRTKKGKVVSCERDDKLLILIDFNHGLNVVWIVEIKHSPVTAKGNQTNVFSGTPI